ncbi:MAG: SpoIIE family protein phosphatase [Bacteroidales bacterium]|nr:SpoIIE family protein phosphatase [Bacteroidales bacterium]
MAKHLLLLIVLALSLKAQAQFNNKPVTNYTPREYGRSYSSYTMSIAQDERGIIYVGTAYGVLQFDGVSWRFIPVKVGSFVTSLNYFNGKVYVGCQGDFGFLKADQYGKYQFQSLIHKIPKYHTDFTTIWKTLVYDSTVVFQSEEDIFLFKNDTIECISPETSFHLAFVSNNTLYVREREFGLKYLSGQELKLVEGGDAFKLFGVFQVVPFGNNKNLILTREAGLWILENARLTKANTPKATADILSKAEVQDAVKIKNDEIAITTLKEGVIVMDSNLNIINHYTLNTGLISSETIGLTEDLQGNIWVATKKGVSRIQHSLPVSIFNQTHGLYGKVQAVAYFGNTLIAGTTDDLFIYKPDGIKHFQSLGNIRSTIWEIEKTPNKLWIAADNGLWTYKNGVVEKISANQTSALEYIPEKDWLIVSGSKGTYIYSSSSNSILQALPNINPDAYGISSSKLKNGNLEVWIGSKTQGVWQLIFSENKALSQTNYFGLEDGLNEDWAWPFSQKGTVQFGSSIGVLKFISAHELFLMQGSRDVQEDKLRGLFALSEFPKDKANDAITAYAYNDSLAFVGMNYNINIVRFSDSLSNDKPLKSVEMGRLNSFQVDKTQLIIAADDGLAIVDIEKTQKRKGFVPQIAFRSISMGQDSIIWHGDSIDYPNFTIPYNQNSVEIHLTSNFIENSTKAKFLWKQSNTNTETFKESENGVISLINLWEGNYTIIAYAENIQGEQSEPIFISFRVLPPFCRTTWAYMLYLMLLISAVILLIRLNTQRLRTQNKRLEAIVAERTREVVEQKEQIQLQKDKIEDILNDIRASINYAQRIQQAMLPSNKLINQILPGHFTIFYPRDVVSGDFYWAMRIKDNIVITVADCTGHGVPGAFMSMLGISLLNEIVGKMEITRPAQILNELRQAIIQALKQTIDNESQKDGMDMSLVSFNTNTLECQWAGANNPLYVFRPKPDSTPFDLTDASKQKTTEHPNGTFLEVKQDRMPVAIHTYINPFSNHTIQLRKGDRLYLFSDGVVDQFGGPNQQKFMSKNLKSLIMETGNINIFEQGITIREKFEDWMTPHGTRVEQIDDVTFIGLEV